MSLNGDKHIYFITFSLQQKELAPRQIYLSDIKQDLGISGTHFFNVKLCKVIIRYI